jgi:CheY-like chemotaxis protein
MCPYEREHIMKNHRPKEATNLLTFDKREIRPRVCILDSKRHIRAFLAESLEELGCVTCESADVRELVTVLDAQMPDLVVLGLSEGLVKAGEILNTLAANTFHGKLLLLAPWACPQVAAIQELGEKLGIAMLPTLRTPFSEGSLRDTVATLLPPEEPPEQSVQVEEAMREADLKCGISQGSTPASAHWTARKTVNLCAR